MRWWRRRSDADFAAEIQAHLELEAEALVRAGHTSSDASAAARRAFGNVTAAQERFHDAGRFRWLEQLHQDLRYAMRQFRRSPGFVAAVLLTIGLGIALNTTVFSVVSATLLHPVPYRDPHRLIVIFRTEGAYDRMNTPLGDFAAYRRQTHSFSDLAAYYPNPFTLKTADDASYLQGAVVTTNSFRLLGVQPVIGRDFLPEEDVPGHDRVVILSWALWLERFGGDSGIMGRVLTLNEKRRTVVGVMPPGFEFPEMERLWVPAGFAPEDFAPGRYNVTSFGRLATRVSLAQADADVGTVAARLKADRPPADRRWATRVAEFRERVVARDIRAPLYLLLGAVALVLLIACANVANLQLARAVARTREMALRTALGAGRGRLARQLLTESVLLSLAGGVLGVLLSVVGIRVVRTSVPVAFPEWLEFRIDPQVLTFAAALSMGAGIIFGLAPALYAARADPHIALKDGGRGSSRGAARNWLRGALVVAEVSLSLVLLVGATLMIQSLVRLQRSRLGFEPEGVITSVVALAGRHYDTVPNRTRFFADVLDRLAARPQVSAAAAVSNVPTKGWSATRMEAEGHSAAPGQAPIVSTIMVFGDYFRAMRIPVLAGRGFTPHEWRDTSSRTVVITETMARQFWPGESAIGRRVRTARSDPGPWLTVVGVTEDIAQQGVGAASTPALFLTGGSWYGMVIVARATGDVSAAAHAVRESVAAVDRGIPVYDVAPMTEVMPIRSRSGSLASSV